MIEAHSPFDGLRANALHRTALASILQVRFRFATERVCRLYVLCWISDCGTGPLALDLRCCPRSLSNLTYDRLLAVSYFLKAGCSGLWVSMYATNLLASTSLPSPAMAFHASNLAVSFGFLS